MASLADAISKGAGRCDAKSLNRALGSWHTDQYGNEWIRTRDRKPNYCGAYVQHEYTDLVETTPVYLGTVEDGGYWVSPEDYESEMVKYQAALEKRKLEEERFRRNHSSW
ncbi:conjugal transfer protein TrbM [Pusillimonas sp. T7-7]|nr:conjugal transfer protein TrbM [Pusillimonas sp. T7-7]